ncbi:MAG: SDR family NAD(P)-dependent oxidoreductase [Candidatus Schekmanbacteria bacterium]|nr:SDR family NAD(P)-dependent oxidoreductase [Candidatus Schekmanbacteria bacterium]
MNLLITGGAGFIGCNMAAHFMSKGYRVVLLDNLSRPGGHNNLNWLKSLGALEFVKADIRNAAEVKRVFDIYGHFDAVLHFAAQVAVTTSVTDPRWDMETNLQGTFNLLEAARMCAAKPIFLYASTNKVYGEIANLKVVEANDRYQYADLQNGVSEDFPLDFHCPYGCSKGAADQYVIGYSRIYGLKTVCFRQSCIYGYHQFGMEDQGWVAWFSIAAMSGRPITIYGDGKQVRDVLFIDDLVSLYDLSLNHIDKMSGEAYNIGGGLKYQLSLLELIRMLEEKLGKSIPLTFFPARPGDQKVFVCNISKIKQTLGWEPQTDITSGIEKLFIWIEQNRNLFLA